MRRGSGAGNGHMLYITTGSAWILTPVMRGRKPTESVRTQVLVAMRLLVPGAVRAGVAGHVLGLLLLVAVASVVLVAATAALEHLLEEAAELGAGGADEGEEKEREGGQEAHC
jgi:hypothetical protein